MAIPSFHIYHASAGSGKTFTLVKLYLKAAFSQPGKRGFRKLLALTFTNKAVNEMKIRILTALGHFTQSPVPEASRDLFQVLLEELQLTEESLRQQSVRLLKDILHNYAFFDISTIDRFNHRLIRTFSKDLGLPNNFEVILDTDLLIEEAVERLLARSGTDSELTDFLIAYTLRNIEEDRSWDVSMELRQQGRLIYRENHQEYLQSLDQWTLEEFRAIQKRIRKEVRSLDVRINDLASQVMEYLDTHKLEDSYFNRKTFPSHFGKILNGDRSYRSLYTNKLASYFEERTLFNTTMPYDPEQYISELKELYERCRAMVMRYNYLRNALSNLVPITVLNTIHGEIETVLKERSWLPIGAFNRLISEQIREQPTPFIYERIGEIYRHFFIDEFQDTSVVQWQNLIPLISGALGSVDEMGIPGSLLLVGDAKQAIYRWRGGEAEQFLQLLSLTKNPFHIPPHIHTLDTNYRSAEEIIRFNNSFFKTTSPILKHEQFYTLFNSQVEQNTTRKTGGYVQLEFLDPAEQDPDANYARVVLDTIRQVLKEGYRYKDMCILLRKNKHAMLLAEALSAHQIPLISPESLLLQAHPKVRFLVNLLYFLHDRNDTSVRFEILNYLARDQKTRHDFISDHINSLEVYLEAEFNFDPEQLLYKSLYDICSLAIKKFKLAEKGGAYLQFFLDEVLEQEAINKTDISSFLDYWETAKGKLGIPSPENLDAIRIMTIHKAKGLEFPIVIYPYANTKIYAEIKPKLWIKAEESIFGDLTHLLLDKKTEMQEYSESISDAYKEEQYRLELDAFNVLYVAMTRAVEALFVFANMGRAKRNSSNVGYNELFEDYLKNTGLWQKDKTMYTWGALKKQTHTLNDRPHDTVSFRYTYKDKAQFQTVVTSGHVWDPKVEMALEHGRWVHQLMSEIKTRADIPVVLQTVRNQGELDPESLAFIGSRIEALVDHPDIAPYFSGEYEVKNEQDILTQNGILLRPDRIMIKEGTAHIIDYKTGEERKSYMQQLHTYAAVLEEMGFRVENKILIYLSEEIKIKFI